MTIWESYLFFSGIINTFSGLALGLLVILKNHKLKVNRSFALLCASFVFYSFFYMMIFSKLSYSKEYSLLFFRLASLGGVFMPLVFLHFVLTFLKVKKNFLFYGGFLAMLFFAVFSFSEYFVADVVPKFYFHYWAIPGFVYHLSLIYTMLIPGYALFLLLKKYFSSQGMEKAQTKYILIGTFISVTSIIANVAIWYDINFPPFAAILMSAYIYFIAYAIIAHHLMDVQIILKRSTVNLFSLALILLIVIPLKFLALYTLPFLSDIIDYLLIVVIVIIFPYVKTRSFEFANKYLFSSSYISQEVISELSYKLRTTLDLGLIHEYIYSTLADAMHFKSFAILKFDNSQKEYQTAFSREMDLPNLEFLSKNEYLNKFYIKKNKAILRGELMRDEELESKEIIDYLTQYGIKLIVPMNIKYKNIGLLVFGEKISRSMYNKEDLQLLEIISGLAAAAIENSSLYLRIKKSKEELEELLEMRNSFLRVINHQLNTPVSIMRMGLSSYKEKIMPAQKSIAMTEAGLNRISSTLTDFWEAYNLEGKNLKMVLDKFNITRLIREKVNGLVIPEGHKINVSDNCGNIGDFYVYADEARISNAFSHLLQNAVNYTKNGEVKVWCERIIDEHSLVKIYVSDTGCGIPEADIETIFDKFTRGSSAPLVQPDGSGLGLFIAKKIIEAHGGEIKVEKTEVNKGTTLSFTLPEYIHSGPDEKTVAAESKTMSSQREKKKKNYRGKAVLFIDGEQGIVDIFRDYFASFGVNFFTSTDKKEIGEIINKNRIDLIYLEIVIPKKDSGGAFSVFTEQGWDILRWLKNTPETKKVPVAVFSGLDSERDKERALQAGAYKFIPKQKAKPSDLLDALGEANNGK